MLASFPRRGFSLDPLMAEARRRARQRRALVAFGVLLFAGLAGGLTLASRSPGSGSPGASPSGAVSSGTYAAGISLRYPGGWTRVQCGTFLWASNRLISLLTTAQHTPTCKVHLHPGPFPPPESLGPDGAAIFIGQGGLSDPRAKLQWNARIGGRPALVPRLRTYGNEYLGSQICPAAKRRAYRNITIKLPKTTLNVGALICGPHFASGYEAVRNILASMRFAKPLQ